MDQCVDKSFMQNAEVDLSVMAVNQHLVSS